ncbi:PREDICTED: beta-secretase 2-like [Acropora digitifera]|uniref:beta-secretase 2-like n=1 Tax=Acropora digitifera TaxID=70779 RepID=UPI00077A8922|nr:PREDICTED: beta-secretase 2-like [Acropora digitifera]
MLVVEECSFTCTVHTIHPSRQLYFFCSYSFPQYNYDKTIVDSGTTNLRVSEEVFDGILDRLKKFDKLGVPDDFWIGRQMMCWNYDKTPWEEFPDMSISLLSSISNSKEFRLKIPPQYVMMKHVESSDTALLTVAYVMAGVCGLCLVPIFVLLAQASLKRRKHYHQLSGAREVANDETSPSDFQNNN